MSLSNDIEQFTQSHFATQLIQSGYISLPRMQQAFIEARKTDLTLIEILEQIAGKPLPPDLVRQYKERNLFTLTILHGIEFIDLETELVDREQIAKLIDSIIPLKLCRDHQILPLKKGAASSAFSLIVAMVNPSDLQAQATLTQLLGHQVNWQRVGITSEDYDKLFNDVIEQYIPSDQDRQRIDQEEVKQQVLDTIVSLLDEDRQEIDQEEVKQQLVDSHVRPPQLPTLMPQKSQRNALETMLSRQSGLLVVSSTSRVNASNLMYSLLSHINQPNLALATVETTMDYVLRGVTQLNIDDPVGKDYASVLRSLCAQNLDGIMVDQLRDPMIARMVVEMSRHQLMLTSIQAPDGASALAYLSQMVDPSLLGDTLIGVIHAHSLPRLCPTCSVVHDPGLAELAQFGITPSQKAHLTFYQPRTLTEVAIEQAREKGRLCRQCHGKGYDGQVGVYEMWRATPAVKMAIAQRANSQTFKQAAKQDGLPSPLEAALEWVDQGQASLQDVAQLFRDDLQTLSIPQEAKMSPQNLTERIANFEKLLITLTQEFQLLKLALDTPSASSLDSEPTLTPIEEAVPQVFYEEQWEQEFDPSKETIAADSSVYEELVDPGDWDLLQQELQPDKETIAADFSRLEDKPTTEEANPFKSIPDPWS